MRLLFVILLSLISGVFPLTSSAQLDSTQQLIPHDAASFESYNRKHHPNLKYSYDIKRQIHNYSGNWDFDGDGECDSLYFIGNGGAHIYFYLCVVLSSEKKKRTYKSLCIDMPFLGSKNDIKPAITNPTLPQFVVADFDLDGKMEIYLNINNSFASIPSYWQKQGVKSKYLLLDYRNGGMVLKNWKLL